MNKIPTLFLRDENDRRYVTSDVHPDAAWVLAGEGSATRKYDGTCVMLDDNGRWWARREVKPGKTPPPNFMPVETDETTGKTMGWEPMDQSPFAKFHAEAVAPIEEFGGFVGLRMHAGTYELIGPKINGNPERATSHRLERHATAELLDFSDYGPITFDTIRQVCTEWLAEDGIEGIVWHHPDGRMAKIKVRDFPPRNRPGAETEGEPR